MHAMRQKAMAMRQSMQSGKACKVAKRNGNAAKHAKQAMRQSGKACKVAKHAKRQSRQCGKTAERKSGKADQVFGEGIMGTGVICWKLDIC